MKLRFIGADGSMDLTHGQIKDVEIRKSGGNLWTVVWYDSTGRRACPYSSFEKLCENWEAPGKDINLKSNSSGLKREIENLYLDALNAMHECVDNRPIEPTPATRQELDIQAIIDDAMEKKDRYVSILVTNEGHMSVNIYPHTEEEAHWIPNYCSDGDLSYIRDYSCSVCGARYAFQTSYCPECGEKLKRADEESFKT